MATIALQLPDELARRAEARALLGDIHRLPERQRSVLVMSALDGLSHEEVAGRLSTTVETTRSLLARARENLRRTATARETACQAVCAALDEAASAGVRASELEPAGSGRAARRERRDRGRAEGQASSVQSLGSAVEGTAGAERGSHRARQQRAGAEHEAAPRGVVTAGGNRPWRLGAARRGRLGPPA